VSKPQQTVTVCGTVYKVIECPGYIKADMQGYFGWTSVWADSNQRDTLQNLQRRIKHVRSGGQ
jgi:hypothetical protein